MHRRQVVLGALGMTLALAAGGARAADVRVGEKVDLAGLPYVVSDVHSLAGAYKNALSVHQPTDFADQANNRKNTFNFVQGDKPENDRLFVAAAIAQSDTADTGDQLYLLTGADANGIFNQKNSTLTQFFGGNVKYSVGGRPTAVLWLNDTDTGKHKDKNLLVTQFANDDHYRFYDLDSLGASYDYVTADVDPQPYHVIKGVGTLVDPGPDNGSSSADVGDPNAPFGGFFSFAPGPDGYVLALAHPEAGDGAEMSVMDLKTGKFLPMVTDLVEATKDQPTPIDAARPHMLTRYAGDEYWFLNTNPEPGGNGQAPDSPRSSNELVRVQITLPADLTKATAGSIKAKVLGISDLLKTDLGGSDDFGKANGVYGLAIGREVSAGKRIVYMGDWEGNIITLAPAP